jgi:hypothetical protein
MQLGVPGGQPFNIWRKKPSTSTAEHGEIWQTIDRGAQKKEIDRILAQSNAWPIWG